MQHVVGAAVVRDGRVLAARRTTPAAAAGRWEFPGGKVEPGETADTALVREVQEELDCLVAVRSWLRARAAISQHLELTVAVAELLEGEPHPHEHDQVRWLAVDELDDVDWLASDRPFVEELRVLLAEETTRG